MKIWPMGRVDWHPSGIWTSCEARGHLDEGAYPLGWRAILKVNYWPIFDIACNIFEVIPSDLAKALADTLAETAHTARGE